MLSSPETACSAAQAIHEAVGLTGLTLPYTTDEVAARTLVLPGFEWMPTTYFAGWVYAPCRRAGLEADGMLYPHQWQWRRTLPLSMCGSVIRAWVKLAKGCGQATIVQQHRA